VQRTASHIFLKGLDALALEEAVRVALVHTASSSLEGREATPGDAQSLEGSRPWCWSLYGLFW